MKLGQERTKALIEYAQQTALMRGKPAHNVSAHPFFRHEVAIALLPGIHLNVQDHNQDEIWLVVNRLHETSAPVSQSKLLGLWLENSNSPHKEPTLKTFVEKKSLVTAGLISAGAELSNSDKENNLLSLSEFDNRDEVEKQLQIYINNLWMPWSIEEKRRRETISLYATLFTLKQQLEGSIIESQLELVWGTGIGVWKQGDTNIAYPLVSRLVELSLNEETMDIEVRPREMDPRIELEIYSAADNPGVGELERLTKEFFSKSENTFSPFDRATFEPLLKSAATFLDPQGVYWPDVTTANDRNIPKAESQLKVTDTWVMFARPRSNSLFIQDLERIKKQVEESQNLPPALLAIVTNPSTQNTDFDLPSFRGMSNVAGFSQDGSESLAKPQDLFFPKPYNDEQVRIIQMLEFSPGVVVQGPPGTGKTHTISNIICHYLALGRRVLVTSMRDPALGVLRDKLPENIQPLCISLLSSEKEGMKQFEYAVEKIASEIQSIDRVSLFREITSLENNIDGLHKRIYHIDLSITRWAVTNLKEVEIDGEKIAPQEAARELASSKDLYEWLTDEISIDPKFTPLMSVDDMRRLREAREIVGIDLDYLNKSLPQLAAFPDSRDLLRVHQDLSHLSRLKEEIENGAVAALKDSSRATFELAANLTEKISNLRLLKSELQNTSGGWHIDLRNKLKNNAQADLFDLFENLILEFEDAGITRRDFLQKPVVCEPNLELDNELVQGIKNLSIGKSPFGLSGLITKSNQKKILQEITIFNSKPNSLEDWSHVFKFIQHSKHLRSLITRWNAITPEISVITFPTDNYSEFGKAVEAIAIFQKTKSLVELEKEIDSNSHRVISSWNHKAETTNNEELLNKFEQTLTHHLTRNRLAETWAIKQQFQQITSACSGRVIDSINNFGAHSLGNKAFSDAVIQSEWTSLMEELKRLLSLETSLKLINSVCDLIKNSGAPVWAHQLSNIPLIETNDRLLPNNWLEAWRLRRISNYLESIDTRKQLKMFIKARSEAETDLAKSYQDVVSKRTWHKLATNATPDVRQALVAFTNAISKIGKGTGKRAVRYRHDARAAATRANPAIPCWIMPHYRVSESLPPELGSFDLVIIDEASQSDLTALPSILRAKKVLIVGDDKQVSPEGIGIEEEKIRSLMSRFLVSQVDTFRAQMTPERSIYDLCKVVFAEYAVMLKEHFRCVGPIIEYSKREFYNHELKPLRLPKASERLDPPLIDIFVENGFLRKTDNTNFEEARFIVDEIKAICADVSMSGRTIGVVSLLGDKQALKIWQMLEEEVGPESIAKFKIACGDAKTFQGKERNIMFLSMVVAQNEPITAISRDTFAQRFNVAASRAQDRMYLVRSVNVEDLRETDKLRIGLISHFTFPFAKDEKRVEDLRDLCESPFEREMYDALTELGYWVVPQVKVGEYRIDMVIEGANDSRLAIECDGDQYHGPDKWEDDLRRQRILERAGWKFWRCFASTFILHKKETMDDLKDTLLNLGIHPVGAQGSPRSIHSTFRKYSPINLDLEIKGDITENIEPEPQEQIQPENNVSDINSATSISPKFESISQDSVQINDFVSYIDIKSPDQIYHIQIVDGPDHIGGGVLNRSRPLAQALLNASIDEEVNLHIPGRETQILKVTEIMKPTIINV